MFTSWAMLVTIVTVIKTRNTRFIWSAIPVVLSFLNIVILRPWTHNIHMLGHACDHWVHLLLLMKHKMLYSFDLLKPRSFHILFSKALKCQTRFIFYFQKHLSAKAKWMDYLKFKIRRRELKNWRWQCFETFDLCYLNVFAAKTAESMNERNVDEIHLAS